MRIFVKKLCDIKVEDRSGPDLLSEHDESLILKHSSSIKPFDEVNIAKYWNNPLKFAPENKEHVWTSLNALWNWACMVEHVGEKNVEQLEGFALNAVKGISSGSSVVTSNGTINPEIMTSMMSSMFSQMPNLFGGK
jgi:hypothetical protein